MTNYKITSKTTNGKLTFFIKYKSMPFVWFYLRDRIGDKLTFNCYIKAKGFLNKFDAK